MYGVSGPPNRQSHMHLHKLTQNQLSELLIVDVRTIRRCAIEDIPIPSHGTGQGAWFDWAEVLEWRDQRKHKALYAAAAPKDVEAVSEKLERALLARVQREQAEIVVAQNRKKVVSIEEFERAMADVLVPVRINFLALASRLRPAIGAEAAAKVDVEVRRALRSLGGEKEVDAK